MNLQKIRNRYIGTGDFYKKTLTIAVPIMIQNGITNFVGLLDNIMVGQLGTEPMSGIAIVNQLFLVFNLAIFGAISGAGIYTAQFYGRGDQEGIRHTFRFKLYICVSIFVLGAGIFSLFGRNLIGMYLLGSGKGLSTEAALEYGMEYMWIMLAGLLPFALEQAYSGTLRECSETVVSMKAGVAAVVVNLLLNYILIFGKLGMPPMGVAGAAIATVISRYVQAGIVIFWTHTHTIKMPFIKGAYRSLAVPEKLAKQIIIHGMPLTVNEILWASGMAMLSQCYSLRGLEAVAAINISTTISNLFNIAFIALGDAIAIIVGQELGAGRFEEAKDTDRKLIAFSLAVCMGIAAVMFVLAPLFPGFYNTTASVKELAVKFMRVAAAYMPIWAYIHAAYFTLRCGGKTMVTFLFDSVFLWVVAFPAAFFLSRYTDMPVIPLYACIQCLDLIKCVIGWVLIKKGVWIQNIVT